MKQTCQKNSVDVTLFFLTIPKRVTDNRVATGKVTPFYAVLCLHRPFESRVSETFQFLCAVTELLERKPHTMGDSQVNITEGRIGFINQMPTGCNGSAAASGKNYRDIVRVMGVPIAYTRAAQGDRICQDIAIAFLEGAETIEEVGVLLHMPGVDFGVFFQFRLIVLMVRNLMEAPAHARNEREILPADFDPEHKGSDASSVRPECESHQIHHQAHLLGMVDATLAFRHVIVRFDSLTQFVDFRTAGGVVHQVMLAPCSIESDPLLDGADGIKILLQLQPIRQRDALLEALSILFNRIQNARLFRVGSLTRRMASE